MTSEISLQAAILMFALSYLASALFLLALSGIYLLALTPQNHNIDRKTKLRWFFPM